MQTASSCATTLLLRYFGRFCVCVCTLANYILITFYGPRGFPSTGKHFAQQCSAWSGRTEIIIFVKICGHRRSAGWRCSKATTFSASEWVRFDWTSVESVYGVLRVIRALRFIMRNCWLFGCPSLCDCRALVRYFWDDSDLLSRGLSPDERLYASTKDQIWCG